jgi:Tol biopolymer transport system component
MPAFGGSPSILASIDVKAETLLDWTGDGKRIIFSTRNTLFSLDIPSRKVSEFGGVNLSHVVHATFAVSPDGGRIAYTDVKDGSSDIWVSTIDGGTPTRITNDEFQENNIVWHPDGKRILYDSVRNEISQIFSCSVEGESSTQVLSSDVPIYLSDVSPDGKKLLYYSHRDEADLWKVGADGSEEIRLTDSLETEMWADPSPDGLSIVYQRSTDPTKRVYGAEIILQSLGSDRVVQQFTKDGFDPAWSPDGEQIAFLRVANGRANLWSMPADGGEERSLTSEGVMFAGYVRLPSNRMQTDFQWSADSRSIVFCAAKESIPNVWRAPVDGTGPVRVTDNTEGGSLFFGPAISPHDGSVAFLRLRRPSNGPNSGKKWGIWVSDLKGTRPLMESDDVLSVLGWSASGNEVIVLSTPGYGSENSQETPVHIYQVSTNSGTAQLIHRLKKAYSMNMKLSPDARTLAYVERDNGLDSIIVVSLAGDDQRTILKSSDQRVYLASIAWSRDGRSIYFGKQANWQAISIMGNLK